MKSLKYLSLLFAVMIASFSTISCSKNNTDPASVVEGKYAGKLLVDNELVDDTYVVSVERVSSTVVTISAKLFPDGSDNYNVEYSNGKFLFKSSTSKDMNISVTGKNMMICFYSSSDRLTIFDGRRD